MASRFPRALLNSTFIGGCAVIATLVHASPASSAKQDLVTAMSAGATHTITGFQYALVASTCRDSIAGMELLLKRRAALAAAFERRLIEVIPKYRERTRAEIGAEAERILVAETEEKQAAYIEQARTRASADSETRKFECAKALSVLQETDTELEDLLVWLEKQ